MYDFDRLTNYKCITLLKIKLLIIKVVLISGPFLVSRYGALDYSKHDDKAYLSWIIAIKRCWYIKTVRRWPWKLESAKECVTTHGPNVLALKIDYA